MPLPLAANIRFSLYRGALPPPADPEAADIPGHLEGNYANDQAIADPAGAFRSTHVLLTEDFLAIRDNFNAFTTTGTRDLVYVPDAEGTPFEVVYIERPGGFLRIFLNRRAANWPTNDL